MALLEDFLSEKVLEPDYAYCDDDTVGSLYKFPQGDDGYHVHIDKINNMPNEELPQIFGFHQNADISKNISQARNLTELLLQIGDVDGAKSHKSMSEPEGDDEEAPRKLNRMKTIMQRVQKETKRPEDELLESICADISMNLPSTLIDMDIVTHLFPIERSKSLNTVLV